MSKRQRERVDSRNNSIEALMERHTELDKQIVAFERRLAVSADEEAELRRLKREKLAAKDRIAYLQEQA